MSRENRFSVIYGDYRITERGMEALSEQRRRCDFILADMLDSYWLVDFQGR